MTSLMLIAGLLLLVAGGEALVRGASRLAVSEALKRRRASSRPSPSRSLMKTIVRNSPPFHEWNAIYEAKSARIQPGGHAIGRPASK